MPSSLIETVPPLLLLILAANICRTTVSNDSIGSNTDEYKSTNIESKVGYDSHMRTVEQIDEKICRFDFIPR
jgi:hypothetical protein